MGKRASRIFLWAALFLIISATVSAYFIIRADNVPQSVSSILGAANEEPLVYTSEYYPFSLEYKKGIEVFEEPAEITLQKDRQTILLVNFYEFGDKSLSQIAEKKVEQTGSIVDPAITFIGMRAGLLVAGQENEIRYFPLDDRIYVEIVIKEATEEIEEIISSIEFLPSANQNK